MGGQDGEGEAGVATGTGSEGAAAEGDETRQHQRLEVIGSLASGVAHEINNPIQSIMNYAQLIRNRSDSELMGEYAGEILHEAQRVAGIIKNLLFFARQEGEPYTEAYMRDLVEQTLSLTAAVLRKEQILVELDLPELPAVLCHPQQVQQVVMNLVTTARDALNARYPKGDDDKRMHISARLHGEGRFVRTTVADHGGGMAAEEAARMFDPEHMRLNHGRGLGLSVSHAIVTDHGGAIGIDNDEGHGCRMHVDLPVAE